MKASWIFALVFAAHAQTFSSSKGHLVVEPLADTLIRVTFYGPGQNVEPVTPSPMLAHVPEPVASSRVQVKFDPAAFALEAAYTNKAGQAVAMGKIAVLAGPDGASLQITSPTTQNLFGLGQQFVDSKFNWLGQVRHPGTRTGNQFEPFHGGKSGNTQIPILYALGAGQDGFALFVDGLTAMTWDFTRRPWKVRTFEKPLTWYWIAGENLAQWRSTYMDMVGHSPVPPKKMLGLWVSQYGYRSWQEVDRVQASMHAHHFPLDGFVLDLQWFGGVTNKSEISRMGTLNWDLEHFPQPAEKLSHLAEQGLGVMAIEEPYVSRGLPEHKALADGHFLVVDKDTHEPVYLTSNPWWGVGGMIDWTNPAAADFWHDQKRQPLIAAGLMAHWTDLGEPEMFSENGQYHAGLDRQVHNLYNLAWTKSIYDGYLRHAVDRRPFMMSRSGTAGSQRYGAALWSADLGSNQASLRGHLRAQGHVALSGIDYYGSDIGGFNRRALDGNEGALYTQWLATSTLFDFPVRPHTENLCHCHETAPDRIGDMASNLENVRRRYELMPYLYSLAHHAARSAAMIVAPLVYFFQQDLAAREIWDQKMIGPSLMGAAVFGYGAKSRDVYLPAGTWFDFASGEQLESKGQWHRDVSVYHGGILQAPLYARAGAIIPLAVVDAFGHVVPRVASVKVFAARPVSEFEWLEDDGVTRSGAVRSVRLSRHADAGSETLEILSGGSRDWSLEYVGAADLRGVRVDGHEVHDWSKTRHGAVVRVKGEVGTVVWYW